MSSVVLDDVLVLEAGDQVVVDATVLESAGLEIDESLLTGESVPVDRGVGDSVLSGSFVVAGGGLCRVTAVGEDSYAKRIEGEGRRYTRTCSEVMTGINTMLKWIGALMIPVGLMTVSSEVFHAGNGVQRGVANMVAPLVAMVPEGLVLLSSIAFAVSALVLAGHHVLANELPAVEGLARTDVVCTDKTGTLTEREPVFDRIELLVDDRAADAAALEADVHSALGAMAAADRAPNETMRALAAAFPAPEGWMRRASVAFSSARKWSAADFGDQGVWVIGAPEIVLEAVHEADRANDRLITLLSEGARVVVLARSASALAADWASGPAASARASVAGETPDPSLPAGLEAVAFVLLSERLRPDAAETVRYLAEQGVEIKILSGDNPSTVSAIARAAGVRGAENAVDARTLQNRAALSAALQHDTVFGRVMPEQKSRMVVELQKAGHSVAMTGDGVNDVLAVKQADLGIAMGSGVPAVKAVAQLVLLDDHFGTFPLITAEGRRVVANAERVANLFLTKSAWAALLAVAVVLLAIPYPFLPRQITLAGSVTIGIPAFFFALGPSTLPYRRGFVPRVLRFAIPAGSVIAVAVLGTFLTARSLMPAMADARTITTLVLILVGLGVIVILEWPLAGWRLAVVASMAGAMAVVFSLPITRDFFALTALTPTEVGLRCRSVACAATAVTALLTTSVRRLVREKP